MGDLVVKKNSQMNIMKALGIVAVVLGHTAFPYMRIVYSYHMALFFFIAGYFFLGEILRKTYRICKKKNQVLLCAIYNL